MMIAFTLSSAALRPGPESLALVLVLVPARGPAADPLESTASARRDIDAAPIGAQAKGEASMTP